MSKETSFLGVRTLGAAGEQIN